jgi:hypothetical protein
MELRSTREAINYVATWQFPSISWKPKVHNRIHKSLSLSWARRIKSASPQPISKRSILILSTVLVLLLAYFLLAFPPITYTHFSFLHSCYMPRPPCSLVKVIRCFGRLYRHLPLGFKRKPRNKLVCRNRKQKKADRLNFTELHGGNSLKIKIFTTTAMRNSDINLFCRGTYKYRKT